VRQARSKPREKAANILPEKEKKAPHAGLTVMRPLHFVDSRPTQPFGITARPTTDGFVHRPPRRGSPNTRPPQPDAARHPEARAGVPPAALDGRRRQHLPWIVTCLFLEILPRAAETLTNIGH